jgi:AAA15 family ATPase/GTPase
MSFAFNLRKDKDLRDDGAPRRGYLMIKSIEIHNFRCFSSVELSNCRRINVIVGKNASGKTAFLEALFLASGITPELGVRIKGWREQPTLVLKPDKSAYDTIWKDLFYRLDQEQTISIKFKGSTGYSRSLSILYESPQSPVIPIGESIATAPIISPVTFVYTEESGKEHRVSPVLTAGGLNLGIAPMRPIESVFLPAHRQTSAQEYATFFSTLSKQKRHLELVRSLQGEFPFVEDISVEIGSDAQAMLWASVDQLPEKVPITLLSAGITKLLYILLAISLHPRGVVIIDEIENGFYFDRLPSVWSLVLQFAKQHEVQIFASTHSQECLESAAEVAKDQSKEFSVIRTVRANGNVEVRQFDGRRFVDAINEGIEVR